MRRVPATGKQQRYFIQKRAKAGQKGVKKRCNSIRIIKASGFVPLRFYHFYHQYLRPSHNNAARLQRTNWNNRFLGRLKNSGTKNASMIAATIPLGLQFIFPTPRTASDFFKQQFDAATKAPSAFSRNIKKFLKPI